MLIYFSFLGFISFLGQASIPDTLITVQGKVLSAEDSTGVQANILYEKLPYFDDMGLAAANSSGDFTFFLVKGASYNISIRKNTFENFAQKVTVNDADGDLTFRLNLYLKKGSNEEVIKLDNVIFGRASDVLRPESFPQLNALVTTLNDNPEMIIQLEGHTDFDGDEKLNMELSQERVDAVKGYIVRKGISKKRVMTKAYGGSRPLDRARTMDARSKNRRVEVRIIKR